MNYPYLKHKYSLHKPFEGIAEAVKGKTMLCEGKLRFLYELAIITDILPGDIAEAGVWEGGACYLLASVSSKTIHALDSWVGLPAALSYDRVDNFEMGEGWGACKVPVEFLSEFGSQVVFHHGLFSNTLPGLAPCVFSLVHVDVDRYDSTKECIEFFWPRVVPGGFIIFDDYGFWGTPGATKAINEYIAICSNYSRILNFDTVLAMERS